MRNGYFELSSSSSIRSSRTWPGVLLRACATAVMTLTVCSDNGLVSLTTLAKVVLAIPVCLAAW